MRDFNFFNDLENRKRRKTTNFTYVASVAIVLAIAMGLVSFFYMKELSELRSAKVALENSINDPAHQKAYTEATDLSKLVKQTEVETIELQMIHQKVLDSRVISNLLIKEIAMAKPDAVAIKSISFTQEGVNIEGTSVNQDLIARFEHNLRGNERFQGPFIPTINKTDDEYYEFNLMINFYRPDDMTEQGGTANGQG